MLIIWYQFSKRLAKIKVLDFLTLAYDILLQLPRDKLSLRIQSSFEEKSAIYFRIYSLDRWPSMINEH